MMTQTLAMFVDAYRELNAKRLFWISVLLSGLIVASMACVGINEKGITVLWWNLDVEFINTTVISKPTFYKMFMFLPVGMSIWLTWAATILALISTASMVPDFIGSGSIELSLSRPIGRLRLFLTKYLAGLTFVALQVSVFTVASFVLIGVRGESWEPRLFLAIPLVLAFFSYLFAVCVLAGLITRSTIASLLITAIFWITIFLVHLGESGIVLELRETKKLSIERMERSVQVDLPARIADLEPRAVVPPDPVPTDDPALDAKATQEHDRAVRLANRSRERLDSAREELSQTTERLEEARLELPRLERIHGFFYVAKSILPKTNETMGLLERQIVAMTDMQGFRDAMVNRVEVGEEDRKRGVDPFEVSKRIERILRERSVAWVLGTSLAFEAAVLAIACWIFCRRDF